MTRLSAIFIFLALFATITKAQTPNITLIPVFPGVDRPVFITHCGDSRVFYVSKGGIIYVSDSAYNVDPQPYLDISSVVNDAGNEQGLLGLAFHPDYQDNGFLYVNYTDGTGAGYSVVERYTVSAADPNQADPASGEILFTVTQPYTNHNGGCMQFGSDGYLYIGFGDGGSGNDPQDNGQDLTTKLGKMLRIDVNYSIAPYYTIPPDNPFINTPGADSTIWAWGLRNPWRFSFDKLNGDLWIGDVGQDAWEEIDFHAVDDTAGQNYGWRCYEGNHLNTSVSQTNCPDVSTLTMPVYEYPQGSACSVTGGYVYRGAQIGLLYGSYLFTDYCTGYLQILVPDGSGGYTSTQLHDAPSVASFGEDFWGELYVCGYSTGGSATIYKIVDEDCIPAAVVLSDTTVYRCADFTTLQAVEGQGFNYQWMLNGNAITGAHESAYTPIVDGDYTVVVTNALACSSTSQVIHVLPSVPLTVTMDSVPDVCYDSFGAIIQVNPTGGTFIGDGVDQTGYFNPFSPDVNFGLQTVVYVVQDSNLCGSDTVTFDFVAPPTVTVINDAIVVNPPNGICVNILPITFWSDYPGGTFSSTLGTFVGDQLDLTIVSITAETAFIVYYQFTDSNGCVSITADSLIGVLCSGIQGVDKNVINIYPNPVTHEFTIKLDNNTNDLVADVFDVSGKLIQSFMIPKLATTYRHSISELSNGVYVLRLCDANNVSFVKLVKASE